MDTWKTTMPAEEVITQLQWISEQYSSLPLPAKNALLEAARALRQRIPTKPIRVITCPCCGSEIIKPRVVDVIELAYNAPVSQCECGQLIDWSKM